MQPAAEEYKTMRVTDKVLWLSEDELEGLGQYIDANFMHSIIERLDTENEFDAATDRLSRS